MKGQVLDYSVQTNAGLISGDDGVRYSFEGANWNESIPPQRGMRVDFEADGNRASSIYADLSQGGGAPVGIAVPQPGNVSQPGAGTAVRASSKSNILAALLAFFLGWLGIHKFYLGYASAGIVHIILTITIIGFWVNVIINLIETIIYLTKSDADFHQTYVVGRKNFF